MAQSAADGDSLAGGRERLLEALLRATAWLLLPMALIMAARSLAAGRIDPVVSFVAGYAAIIALNRVRSLGYRKRALYFCAVLVAIACRSPIAVGFALQVSVAAIVTVVIAALLLGTRHALAALAIILAVLAAAAGLDLHGRLFPGDVAVVAPPSIWAVGGLGIAVGAGILAVAAGFLVRGLDEARLRAVEAARLLQSILDRSRAVVYVKDLDGRYTLVNRRHEELFGVSKENALGKTDADIFPAEIAGRLREADRRVAGSGVPEQLEEVVPHADGPHTYISVKFPLTDASGRTYAVCGISTDITARTRAEEALRKSERFFRAILEHAHDVVSIFDDRFVLRHVSASAERVLGYRPADLVGTDALALIHPDDQASARDAIARILAGPDASATASYRFRHKDGSWRRLESFGRNLLHDPDLAGVVVNTRDATEQVALEEQLRQAQKMDAIGRLAGGVAHDFNNLLTAVMVAAETAARDLGPADPAREAVRDVLAAADRAAALTRQLLAFSRRQVLVARPVDLSALVAGMAGMLRRLIGEPIAIETALPAGLPAVRADPGQLEQIVLNLAVNARDAMPGGGRLTIETATVEVGEGGAPDAPGLAAGANVALAVTDTGAGMSEEVKSHLFEPFFTTKGVNEGTGLGLATVYGIVRQSGGRIGVRSASGEGSRFRVYLPATRDAAEAAPAPPPPASDLRGSATLLLVEDEAAIRKALAPLLRRTGYAVLEAASGADALRVAAEHAGAIDLLLTDVVMPGMTGPTLARRLGEARPGLKVLFMSGYARDEPPLPAPGGGVGFIDKPFRPERLLEKLRETLGRG